MGGAYTSKPEIPVTNPAPPEIPVDWNPQWSFPGPPYSPGYTPSYVLSVSGQTSISPEDSAVLTSKLVDRQGNDDIGYTEYIAEKSIEEETQTWTATIDGAPLQLKAAGGSFGSEIEVTYSEVNRYQACVEEVLFQLTASDIGGIIEVTFTSLTGGEEYHEIEVKGVVIYGIIYELTRLATMK
jgi:hypothetical protein